MWVAVTDHRIVGFRAFLRWEFATSDGASVRAVRAVDTATDPDYQGQGVFTRLTRTALEELRSDSVTFVFNTPNAKSLPGYLKMGWERVGRVPASIRVASLRAPLIAMTARQGADRWSLPTTAGQSAPEVLAETGLIEGLLRASSRPTPLSTRRSTSWLRWRYGFERLAYRAMLLREKPEDGLAFFRLRRRGRAVEAVVCDVLVPGDAADAHRSLSRRIAAATGPDYLIRLGGGSPLHDRFVRVPGVGPMLACRRVTGPFPRSMAGWSLTMGDIELF